MSITRQKKEEILKELVDKFSRSQSIVFADYRGLDVASISKLRNLLRENQAEMKVAKKTLIDLAAKENKIEIEPSSMEGPVAATFSYEDPLSGIQALFKFSKENENLKLLGGVINGEAVGPDIIEKYAKLPSHEELIAKFIGSMNSPVSGFVGLLGNVLGGFVRVINAYKDTLPQEVAPATPEVKAEEVKEEPKVEETTVEEVADTPAEEATETPSEDAAPAETPAEEPKVEEEKPAEETTEAPEASEEETKEESTEEPKAEEDNKEESA